MRLGRVADRSVVVLDLPAMELEDQDVTPVEPLVFRAAVRALDAEESLIPAAARLDVGHRDQGLGTHPCLRDR
jgi:hypothetical protein